MKKIIKNTVIFVLLSAVVTGAVCFIISKVKSSTMKIESDENILEYSWEDRSIPGGHYDIKINFIQKWLYVKEIRYNSSLNGTAKTSENNIKLSDEEVNIIKQITKEEYYNKGYLSHALSSIVLGDKIFSTHETDKKYDSNGDGIVTNREFGDNFLKVILADN